MIKYILIISSVLFFSCNTSGQINKNETSDCEKGFYWFEGNSEKTSKDSVAVTGYIKVVDKEIHPPAPFAAIYFNEQKAFTDKDGKVYIKLPIGEYVIRANNGGSYFLTTKKLKLNSGGATITFYLKSQLLVD